MEGLKIWVTTLIQYDKYGNGVVLKSFSKISKDSEITQQPKTKLSPKKSKMIKSKNNEEKELW
jgi:hypothetical protein